MPANFVVDLATDENDGNTGAGDLCLREAINLANVDSTPDTINFLLNANMANQVQTLTLGVINITKPVNIVVNFPDLSQVRISGNNASPIFNLTGAGTAVTIQGVTLQNGRGRFGGAISVNSGTTLNLTQCVLRDNVAQGSTAGPGLGGAIANDLGTVVIDRCAFLNNQALGENGQNGSATGGGGGGGGGAGAGGAIWTDATVTISNSTFSGNLARGGNGGAGFANGGVNDGTGGRGGNGNIAGGSPGVTGSTGGTFQGGGGGGGSNATGGNGGGGGFGSGGGGGGAKTGGGSGGAGGAGSFGGGTGGQALSSAAAGGGGGAGLGGAIYIGGNNITLVNCTLVGNTAQKGAGGAGNGQAGSGGADGSGQGGGVYVSGSQNVNVKNTILANNVADVGIDFTGAATSQTRNIIGNTAGSSGFGASDLLNTNPNLSALTNLGHTYAYIPNVGSPAINAGTNTGITATTDQRGANFQRIVGATVDIGAFEVATIPTSFIVDVGTDDQNNGVDGVYTPGNLTLREAISQANATPGAQTITFAPALYASPLTLQLLRGELLITGDTTIAGPGSGLLTIRTSASNLDRRAFTIDDGSSAANKTVTISGLAIAGGNVTSANGGAILNSETLTLEACTLSANLAVNGGAIYQPRTGRGILSIKNSTLSGNTATNGGGALFSDSPQAASVTIDHSTISNNTGNSFGGGIVHYDGGSASQVLLQLFSSTVSGNRAVADVGGGLVIDGASSTGNVTSSTISGNTAVLQGGGVFARGSSLPTAFINCTFSGNSSRTNGGGLYNESRVSIYASTITLNGADSNNNSASEAGGGIFTAGGRSTSLYSVIVAGNFVNAALITDAAVQSNDIAGANVQADSVNNLISEPTAAGGLTNGVNGNLVGDAGQTRDITTVLDIDEIIGGPTFATGPEQGLNDNGGPTKTHALVQNSPAIGAGTQFSNGLCCDQRDAFRDPTAPDIGAYEVQHPLAPVGAPSTFAATFQPRPSASANEAFIKGLYQSTLLRAPAASEVSAWLTVLSGGATKSDVAYGFVNSVENRTNQVTFFYKYFLGRSPDSAGLSGWVNVLQAGVDEGAVMSGFLLSPEFTGNNSNASFVNLMYYALLGRQAEPTGFNGWVAQLNSGQSTREQVGNGFLRSTESITRVVIADFGSYLKRTITQAAAAPYVSQIASGITFGRVAANILGSDEFYIAAGQNL